MIFVDTGPWFALSVRSDQHHQQAVEWFRQNELPLITTDYVIDELLTLLRKGGHARKAQEIATSIERDHLPLEWVTPKDVRAAARTFHELSDKEWSFTDCVSKVVMQRLEITTACSFDKHFRQFGTVTVVPDE